MKILLTTLLSILCCNAFSQNKPGTSFYGEMNPRAILCPGRMDALSEADVNNLITEMLGRYGIRNRYIIMNCTEVSNCQATMHEGKPYILYNPSFLSSVKKLNFKNADLPVEDKDWTTLTILAHELGHHVNNHLVNPLPDATQWNMELEADETAGFIIYLMGGTLSKAQLAFKDVPETGDYTHPGRQRRLEAVKNGWNDAQSKYPPSVIITEPNVIDKDNNKYRTVKIGNQVWLESNLNVSKFRDGTIIPEAKTAEEWKAAANNKQPAWCYYNNEEVNGVKFGKLYNWYAVSHFLGLAPEGCHIPSDEDWTKLTDHLGNQAANHMKTSGYYSLIETGLPPGTTKYNASGFSGLPGGYRDYKACARMGNYSGMWSSSEDGALKAWVRGLAFGNSGVMRNLLDKGFGFYVRCIKD